MCFVPFRRIFVPILPNDVSNTRNNTKKIQAFFGSLQPSFPDQQRIFVLFLLINVPILPHNVPILPHNVPILSNNVTIFPIMVPILTKNAPNTRYNEWSFFPFQSFTVFVPFSSINFHICPIMFLILCFFSIIPNPNKEF